MTPSRDYWARRRIDQQLVGEQLAVQRFGLMVEIYNQALRNVEVDVSRLFASFAREGVIEKSVLSEILTVREREELLTRTLALLQERGVDMQEYAVKTFLGRLTRLEALKQQVYIEIKSLSQRLDEIGQGALAQSARHSYTTTRNDVRERMGLTPVFATVTDEAIKTVLNRKWEGGNYSTRIWQNTDRLARTVRDVLGAGLTVGTSQEKMATQIRRKFEVGQKESMRLIRTEANFIQSQMHMEVYKDEGIEEYEYVAILDNRTSQVCTDLDGEVFRIDEAVVGKNYPPMHPWCRSSTMEVIDPLQSLIQGVR